MTTWQREFPNTEGWYFWRRSERSDDPFYWRALFIEDDSENDRWTVWEAGAAVEKPSGGIWHQITAPC